MILLLGTPEGFDYVIPAPAFSGDAPVGAQLKRLENIMEVPWAAALRLQRAAVSGNAGAAETASATLYAVSEGYFDIAHEPLAGGRLLNRNDMDGKPVKALINQKGAESLFTGGDALGKTVAADGLSLEIVGILKGGLRTGESDEILIYIPITAADTDSLPFQTMEIKTLVTGAEQKALTAALLKSWHAGGTLQDGGKNRFAALMPLWLVACVAGFFMLRYAFRWLGILIRKQRERIREELRQQYAGRVTLRAVPRILPVLLLCAAWLCGVWLLLSLAVLPFYTFTDWIPESPADPASVIAWGRNLLTGAAASAVYKNRSAAAMETAAFLIRTGCLVCLAGLAPFRRRTGERPG